MDPKQLRTLLAIVELESFTRASRKLGMSQSAISQHIGGLEKQVGVQLLVRSGGGARPTRAGALLAQYARQILGKIDEAQRLLSDLSDGGGVLRIGASAAASHYLLPATLKDLQHHHPRVEVQIRNGTTARTVERLQSGELDVGLVLLPLTAPKLRLHPIGFDELKAVVPEHHAWARRPAVLGTDFVGERFLAYGRGSRTHHVIERFFLEHGVFPQIVAESDHVEAAIANVASGLGVTIAPSWVTPRFAAEGSVRIVPIGKGGLTRSWGIAHASATLPSPFLKAFVRIAKEGLPTALSR